MKRIEMKQRLVMLLVAMIAAGSVYGRQHVNFDFDWKFVEADDSSYSQAVVDTRGWQDVRLPHDWNIKETFDFNIGGHAAYLPEGIGWYRKRFKLPAEVRDKMVAIHFDGIFMQSDVWVNGHHLGYRPYGFCSIEYDMTPYLNKTGDNELAVRVNTTGGRPRWYAGAGIYRHAWLEVRDKVHVATYGTYITTPQVSAESSTVNVETTVVNATSREENLTIIQRIIDPTGREIAQNRAKQAVAGADTAKVAQVMTIKNVKLWDIDSHTLYTMVTEVKAGSKVVDKTETAFGVREYRFDAQTGFWLNGKHVKLKGLCLHQDAGSMGVAVPDRVYERRLEILKEFGCNALRMAHNQPSPEVLDMCDRMGFVVIDEAFDKWKSGYYEKYFDEWWRSDMSDMILRDRNHPSIILWSIGNELQEAWNSDDEGVERARMLQDFVHKLEPTRPVTLAAQNNHQGKFSAVVDVSGYNYLEARAITDHRNNPKQCFLISEELPYYSGEEGNIRAYSTVNPWNLVKDNEFFAGGFIWSGVDYLGEAGWPGKGWPNGLFDICMHEKARAAYHRAMWKDEPMVRIAVLDNSLNVEHGRDLWQAPKMAEHWTYPWNYDGLIMQVNTVTNCQEVELKVNDKLMGRNATADFPNNTILWNVPYSAGTIEAIGYNDGVEVARYKLVTSGKTASAQIVADRETLKADGQEVSHISVTLEDENGNKVSTDDRKITVTVEGEGELLAVDSGELRREEPFGGNAIKTYFGEALVVVRSTRNAGAIKVRIDVEGVVNPYLINISTTNK
jgi:beta-galactosidase